MRWPQFCGGGYESQSWTADQERTVNWIFEKMESRGAISESTLYPTPGVEAVVTTLPAIAQPSAPVITNQGAAGATTYGYKIVGLLADGSTHSQASAEGTTATGNATLTGVNFNRLTWTAVTNAVSYIVYRTTGGVGPPVKLTTTTAVTYDDVGAVGTSEIPASTNTTGIAFVPTGPGRAAFYQSGRYFQVEGAFLYELNSTGILTPRGMVAIGANPATISSNGDGGGELFITSGDNGYIFDLTTNLVSQVAALNGKATMGDSLDGYFLALDANNSKLYISDLLDGLTWDPTQFAQRTIAPDPWRAMRVNGRYIWLLGEKTSEVWYDTGASPFPFAPYPSGLIYFGIAAAFSAAVGDGTITWLAASATGDRFVVRASGFTPEVVSDSPRQYIFSLYGTVSDAQAEVINWIGHTFYRLTFPTEDQTWYWDSSTGKWGEWMTWISEQNRYAALRPRWHAMAFGEHRILDASTGSMYRMDATLTQDVDGRPIRRLRRAPGLVAEAERIFYAALQLDIQPGVGTSTGQGANPQVMARFSRDGGQTWGTEIMASVGPIGTYSTRVMWNRLGSARRMVVEVSITDPVASRIVDAYLDLGQPIKALQQQQRSA